MEKTKILKIEWVSERVTTFSREINKYGTFPLPLPIEKSIRKNIEPLPTQKVQIYDALKVTKKLFLTVINEYRQLLNYAFIPQRRVSLHCGSPWLEWLYTPSMSIWKTKNKPAKLRGRLLCRPRMRIKTTSISAAVLY